MRGSIKKLKTIFKFRLRSGEPAKVLSIKLKFENAKKTLKLKVRRHPIL